MRKISKNVAEALNYYFDEIDIDSRSQEEIDEFKRDLKNAYDTLKQFVEHYKL
jgi:prefoldin subunit 5